MNNLVRNLCIGGVLAGALGLAAEPSTTKVQGVLMDQKCSGTAKIRIVPGDRLEGGMLVAYTHTRQCALMAECQKSGYGVVAYDSDKYLTFDAAGNQKALALLKQTRQADDLRVEVTGTVSGEAMKVASIRLLPQ